MAEFKLSQGTASEGPRDATAELGFRQPTRSDIAALVALEVETFEFHRIDRQHFLRLFKSPSVYAVVVDCQGRTAGYALVFLRRGKTRARLYSIAVEPTLRGRGVGRALLTHLAEQLRRRGQRRLSLEVRSSDDAARRFYERFGFTLLERLPGYYDDGAEALRLVVDLA